ncbi:hypothetical protein [Zoogloea sp.]|uniref:hypothetical protein n=1 Tax=Zoogloea sp. TaxID=49181 RepID=UPI0035AF822E
MSAQFAPPQSSLDKLDAALRRLVERHAFSRLADPDAFDGLALDGLAVLLLTDDPQRSPESLDVAVVLPEALRALGLVATALVADAGASPALARRFGVNRYPAVVVLQGGEYLGTLAGILDWGAFVSELGRIARALPSRPPISIATQSVRSCA